MTEQQQTKETAALEAHEVVGKKLEHAQMLAATRGLVVRAMKQNGGWRTGDMGYRPERVNVSVENGVVTGILGRG